VNNKSITIKFFKALHGDCFLLIFNGGEHPVTFLIDGGLIEWFSTSDALEVLKHEYNKPGAKNYVFATHVCDDHIGGIKYLFQCEKELSDLVTCVFFNTFTDLKNLIPDADDDPPEIKIYDIKDFYTSSTSGRHLHQVLHQRGIKTYTGITNEICPITIDDVTITFLSPSKINMETFTKWAEAKPLAYTSTKVGKDYSHNLTDLKDLPGATDPSPSNASSIAMIIEWGEKKLLFLADARAAVVEKSLKKLGYSKDNKLNVNVVKVSHHGSRNNTSKTLMECIKSDKFLISTNGGSGQSVHPDKTTMAYIVYTQDKPELIFNYEERIPLIFTPEELNSGLFDYCSEEEIII